MTDQAIEQCVNTCYETKGKIPTCSVKPRKKRKPSAYNLYMKKCIIEAKQANPKQEHKLRFKECAVEYKKQKGK